MRRSEAHTADATIWLSISVRELMAGQSNEGNAAGSTSKWLEPKWLRIAAAAAAAAAACSLRIRCNDSHHLHIWCHKPCASMSTMLPRTSQNKMKAAAVSLLLDCCPAVALLLLSCCSSVLPLIFWPSVAMLLPMMQLWSTELQYYCTAAILHIHALHNLGLSYKKNRGGMCAASLTFLTWYMMGAIPSLKAPAEVHPNSRILYMAGPRPTSRQRVRSASCSGRCSLHSGLFF